MKRTTKTTLAILALGASSWAIIAQQNGGRDSGISGGPGGPGIGWQERPGGIRSLPPVFRALDTNHDGVIDSDEIANAPAALRTLLKDGSTTLTLEDLLGQRPMYAHSSDDNAVNLVPARPVSAIPPPDMAPGRLGGPNGPGSPGGPPHGDQ